MRLLLDTHVWIWSQESPQRLGPKATAALDSSESEWYLSPISTLEVTRLVRAGHFRLGHGDLRGWIQASSDELGCLTLDVSHAIAREAYSLPGEFHKDPADRVLVATARIHGLTLVTADRKILDYAHVECLDAAV